MTILCTVQKKLGDFDLNIRLKSESKRIGILGASGSGKSLTLKCIAGIEQPVCGEIILDGKVLYDSKMNLNIRPQKRKIGYLFQNYALFPTMSVEENVAAGLKGNREEKCSRVERMIQRFQLNGLEKLHPSQLSGGQQQRVALARIMAYEPDAILLDEPFSALDMYLKDQLQLELQKMLQDYHGLVLLVSHDRDEIYRFSEELLVLDKGKTVTFGKTSNIFKNPEYMEAAKLTGCKNFSRIRQIDAYSAEILDWGGILHMKTRMPPDATHIGYRAHDFQPIWGMQQENCIPMQIMRTAKLPFEEKYYFYPDSREIRRNESDEKPMVCWFVQREEKKKIMQYGAPDYLKMEEDRIMFLKDKSEEKKQTL